MGALFIIFLLGVRDDLVPFSAWNKMLGQIAAIIVLLFSEIRISSFYGLFGVNDIPMTLSLLLTFLFILIVTNAYNLIDGLDGLAGTLGIITYFALGFWFFMIGEFIYALLCFSMLGSLLAFLIFNWEPAEIFMGDSGAMVNGLMLSAIIIHFMNTNEQLVSTNIFRLTSTIGSAACFIIVPLLDTVRIIILRISKGISPLTPDKNHLHHGLVRLGYSHSRTTFILGFITAIFIVASYLMRNWGDQVVIPLSLFAGATVGVTLDRLLIRKIGSSNQKDK
jgi:UDP-N-acetylmuramyl pentapeptide phosphotransferase/UDP-N-acetylglucosamine-1-phosphate transferase